MPRFVDRVVIHAKAGNGGHGCASVHREKFKPLGGPDGGNGGRGGSIVLVVDPQVHTLLDFHFHPHVDAPSGKQGMGGNRDGAAGADLEVRVPDGTVVLDENGKLLADLVGAGTRFDAAAGGRGGLGNAALASRARKAPGFALLGEKGQVRDLTLELKTVADVGLVGFPSAGKSSLVSAISAAKPKIADYPFTTLTPNLGVVSAGEHTFTVADVPGLIPGASEGRGLGLEFLRHIERCAVLVHVVDCATLEPGRDPISDIDALEAELAAYTPTLQGDTTLVDLAARPRAIVLNKIDVPEARELADFVREEVVRRFGWPVFEVSTVAREGLRPLTFALWDMVSAYRASQPAVVPRRPVIRPIAVNESGFTVESDGAGGFVVRGAAARTVDRTNGFHQRRGRGIPRRPAGATRCRGRTAEARCETRLRGHHRRHDIRLGAADPGGRRCDADRTRHRRAVGTQRPGGGRRAEGRQTPTSRAHGMTSAHREAIRTARSIVVKVGTTALTTPSGVFDVDRLATLADAIERRMEAGSDVVIVSSGAIAAGIEPLKLSRRPADLATKQAAASVGQVALVNAWNTAFARYQRTVGQVLLTAHDISMRVQHTNAQRTLDRLRALHAVAIVNENDTVATNEIRFGDNDRLSALVAHLIGADALVLLSDIDGLYDSDPRKGERALNLRGESGRQTSTASLRDGEVTWVPAGWRRSCPRRCWPPTRVCRCCWPRRPTRLPRSSTRRWARCSHRAPNACRRAGSGSVTPRRHPGRSRSTTGRCGRSCGSGGRFFRQASPRCRVGSTAVTSSSCARRTRPWWPAVWWPTTTPNWPRCWAGRRRICPPRCADPPSTPTIWSPSSR